VCDRQDSKKHLEYAKLVDILTLEGFIAKANQGRL